MSVKPSPEQTVRVWLAGGVDALPDRVLDAVLAELDDHPQRRSRWGMLRGVGGRWRVAFAASTIVVISVIGLAGLAGLRGAPEAGIGPTAPAGSSGRSPSPSPVPSPTLRPGDGTAPPYDPTPGPVKPDVSMPVPTGADLPASLVGRTYDSVPPSVEGSQALILTLRAADDPQCVALYGGSSTCFTILWQPNYPLHWDDPGVRGPARIVGGQLVLGFAYVPNDPTCQGTSSTYAIASAGTVLTGVRVPACSFNGFASH